MIESCFVTNGTLIIRYAYWNNKIILSRCCLLKPFIELDIEDFKKIIEKYGIDWGDANAERGESEQ